MTLPSGTPDANRNPDEPNTPNWRFRGYAPNHPWYYLPYGDNQPPLSVEQISTGSNIGTLLSSEVTTNPRKREAQLRKLLADEQQQLAERIARYQEVVERGAAALSDFDRNICFGGDLEKARACALASYVTQISWLKARVAWLKRELDAYGPTLF